jgi:hypothetical protein
MLTAVKWLNSLIDRFRSAKAEQPSATTPDPVAHRDPGAQRDAAADEQEKRSDFVNEAVEKSDSEKPRDPPDRYTT